MNFRKVAPILVIASLVSPAVAQERVVVGTQRLTDNAALFLAAAAGYFKAEGIDLAMTAYENDRMVAEALASGATDLALTGFTPVAFDFAGKGTIKAIAARATTRAPSSSFPTSDSARACRNSRISPARRWRSTRWGRYRVINWSRSRGSRKLTSIASR